MVSINYGAYPSAPDLSGFERGLAGLGDIVQERRTRKVLDQFADSLYPAAGGEMSLASLAPRETSAVRTAAPPEDYASKRVAEAHAASGGGPQAGAIEAYIRHAAKQRGIDPDVAVRVAMSEGGVTDPTRQSDVVKNGVREQSYGPFQLYMNGGLGNEALAAGIDPRKDWQAGIDFALDKAKEGGWGPWYGAAKAGIGERDGIGGVQGAPAALAASPGVQMAQSSPAGSQGGLLPPREVMMQLLRNRETRPIGIALAQSAQGLRADQNDPMKRLAYEKAMIELQQLRAGGGGEFKVVGDQLVRIGPSGQVSDVTPGGTAPGSTDFRFTGKSVEAQALNGLIDSGQITTQQAQQLGAGKTITGANGEIIFMTPQGVFQRSAQGGQPQPLTGGDGNIQITEPKVTIDEKKAMTFADRMTASGKIIDEMGMKGFGKGDQLVSGVPVFGEYLTSDDFKTVDQAKRDFINAQLRRESGAVISEQEFDNANKQYFPQPNDPPQVLEQKRRNRQIVIDGMARDSGPTYRPRGAAAGNRTSSGIDWSIED